MRRRNTPPLIEGQFVDQATGRMVTEYRTAQAWASLPNCVVPWWVLLRRVRMGWPFAWAMQVPEGSAYLTGEVRHPLASTDGLALQPLRKGEGKAIVVVVGNEKKTLKGWSQSHGQDVPTMRRRMEVGIDADIAVTLSNDEMRYATWAPPELLEAGPAGVQDFLEHPSTQAHRRSNLRKNRVKHYATKMVARDVRRSRRHDMSLGDPCAELLGQINRYCTKVNGKWYAVIVKETRIVSELPGLEEWILTHMPEWVRDGKAVSRIPMRAHLVSVRMSAPERDGQWIVGYGTNIDAAASDCLDKQRALFPVSVSTAPLTPDAEPQEIPLPVMEDTSHTVDEPAPVVIGETTSIPMLTLTVGDPSVEPHRGEVMPPPEKRITRPEAAAPLPPSLEGAWGE